MYRVTREISFCYGHRLMNYAGKCRHLHGHNGRAVITLEAPALDSCGMVIDFTRIREVVADWIDRTLDHRMLLREDDPALAYLREHGEPVYILKVNPTAENIAKIIFDYAQSQGFPVIEVQMWETDHCFASYGHDSRNVGAANH